MHKMAFAYVFGPEKKNGFGPFSYKFFVCITVGLSTRFNLSIEMSKLTRDGTAKPVLRDQILRRERGQREMLILLVQLTTCRTGSRTRLIHILAIYVTILAHIQSQCVAASPEFYPPPGHFPPWLGYAQLV